MINKYRIHTNFINFVSNCNSIIIKILKINHLFSHLLNVIIVPIFIYITNHTLHIK